MSLTKIAESIDEIGQRVVEALPSVAELFGKIDPHSAAVDKILEAAPRFEAVADRLEQLLAAGVAALPEPPAPTQTAATPAPTAGKGPIEVSAPGTEAKAEAPAAAGAPEEKSVTIEVTPEEAAALGKSPIQVSLPQQSN